MVLLLTIFDAIKFIYNALSCCIT